MDFKKFFLNPITITVGIILTLGILAIVGYNYWGWFGGKDGSDFPANPKDGDKYTKGGKVYIYRAINCITTPCEGGTWNLYNEGHSSVNRQSSQSSNSVSKTETNSASRNSSVAKKKCWEQAWTDVNGRKYQFEIWSADCNSAYVTKAKDVLTSGLNGGKLSTELNSSQSLNMPLNDVVNNLIYELTGFYGVNGAVQFKIAGNGVYGTGTTFTPPPLTQWNIYITTQEPSKHTAILRGTSSVPSQFKIGQKINVVLTNPWNPSDPARNYQATILSFTSNPLEIVTDIPYVPLTNLPPNIIPTMGSGRIIL